MSYLFINKKKNLFIKKWLMNYWCELPTHVPIRKGNNSNFLGFLCKGGHNKVYWVDFIEISIKWGWEWGAQKDGGGQEKNDIWPNHMLKTFRHTRFSLSLFSCHISEKKMSQSILMGRRNLNYGHSKVTKNGQFQDTQ